MNDERLDQPSASSFRRYELCHGSYQLEREARELGQLAHQDSKAARRGERIHAWLAGIPDEDGNEIILSESEQTTADFLMERTIGERHRIFGEGPEVRAMTEQRLWLKVGKQFLTGRVDRVYYIQDTALVIDWKSGFSEPDPAETNAQLKVLAVLVALALPSVKEVIVQIISGPYGVSEARYDIAALRSAYEDIALTLRAINEPEPTFSPSPEACRYCPAILICQAVKNMIRPTVLQFSDLPTGGARAAQLLDEISVLQMHFDEVRKFYSEALTNDPACVPGYAMVPGTARREVTDWVEARAKLEEFVSAQALDALASFSIPAVEKLLGESIGVRGAKLKEQLALILGENLQQKYPTPSLKRVKGEPKIKELQPA